MKLRSPMQHSFAMIPRAEIPRSSFDRSHGYKTTFDAGYLIPIFIDEALPGDTFNLKMTGFSRMATPIFPIMDNMYMETFWFAVPYRLLWDNWERMNGAQDAPDDTTDYVTPKIDFVGAGAPGESTIWDYFGLPVNTGNTTTQVSAFPARAYNLIYNEWFRDENLIDPAIITKGDGPDASEAYYLRQRGKRHDYFTSCLPWPQKGDSIDLPLGVAAPIETTNADQFTGSQPGMRMNLGTGATPTSGTVGVIGTIGDITAGASPPGVAGATQMYPTNLIANLTDATAATINQLRQAFQIQRLLERDARGGTRYTEILRAHFGVTSPDARLQRPEYLGGGSSPVNISPVAQTGETATTPQGNLAAFGTVNLHGHGFVKSFTEHCVIIGLVCVRADLTYQQGLNRMWSRNTRFDYYWPALSHIGEQAVLTKEIFCDGTAADETVFGYQERYAEYRYKPSQITGAFRSTAAAPLDAWHLAQEFTTAPVLGPDFINEAPPIDRVIAVPEEPHFLFDSYFSLRCARPMPMFGVPGLIDHF